MKLVMVDVTKFPWNILFGLGGVMVILLAKGLLQMGGLLP